MEERKRSRAQSRTSFLCHTFYDLSLNFTPGMFCFIYQDVENLLKFSLWSAKVIPARLLVTCSQVGAAHSAQICNITLPK